MLSRLLNKKYNYESEVIDPRHYVLLGLEHREELYTPDMASYYDLIVGLHPDEATRPVVESALIRPVVVVPCCNFWDKSRKLNTPAIADEIEKYFRETVIPSQQYMDANKPYYRIERKENGKNAKGIPGDRMWDLR